MAKAKYYPSSSASISCEHQLLLILLLGLGFIFSSWMPYNIITFTQACFGDIGDHDGWFLKINGYQNSCPEAEDIIFSWVEKAVTDDPRMAASLLRLHFHDCFVNGCDASVLLDDSIAFIGEKNAAPNSNSLRGFEVIDAIKSDLEAVCPDTVSCADILATVARDSVVLSGGPGWDVQMGRKDSLSASITKANSSIPSPNSNITTLITKFQNLGLNLNDLVALSGAHTIGKARCSTFSSRLKGDSISGSPDIDLDFIATLKQLCSQSENNNNNMTLAELDLVTPATFDNQYFVNLVSGDGLLPSDQALMAVDGPTRDIVETYANDIFSFFEDFKTSMVKMGALKPLIGENGQIRRNCRIVN